MDNVVININVFGMLMKHRIVCNVWDRLIVIVKDEGLRMRDAKVGEELLQPNEFTSGDNHSVIFSFSKRASNNSLFLSLPGDQTIA